MKSKGWDGVLFVFLIVTARSVFADSLSVSPSVVRLGTVFAGQTRTNAVALRNDGREPIVIAEVDSDCACTVPDLGRGVLLPLEERRFPVIFNSAGRSGFQEHLVSIETSDGVRRIAFSARVVEAIRVFPSKLHVTLDSAGEFATNIVVRFAKSYAVPAARDLKLRTEDPAVSARLVRSQSEPLAYNLPIRIDVDDAMQRLAYSHRIDLEDARTGASARIQIQLNVEAPLTITPGTLNLGLIPSDRIGRRTEVMISPRAGRSATILSAKASHPWLETALSESSPGAWRLSAWVAALPVNTENEQVFVELTTDNSRLPIWRVPVLLSVLGSRDRESQQNSEEQASSETHE